MEYKIKRGIISYTCPSCQNPLDSKIEEAGMQDTCPICHAAFTVPGKEEIIRRQTEERQREEAQRVGEALRAQERQARLQARSQEQQLSPEALGQRVREQAASREKQRREEEYRKNFTIPAYDKSHAYIGFL